MCWITFRRSFYQQTFCCFTFTRWFIKIDLRYLFYMNRKLLKSWVFKMFHLVLGLVCYWLQIASYCHINYAAVSKTSSIDLCTWFSLRRCCCLMPIPLWSGSPRACYSSYLFCLFSKSVNLLYGEGFIFSKLSRTLLFTDSFYTQTEPGIHTQRSLQSTVHASVIYK